MAIEKAVEIKINTQPGQSSVKELRNQLKKLKDEMAGLEEGSDAFLEVANKAGTLKHQIDEINETVSGASADFGDMLSNATRVTNGIIGGFTAAQGALNLFGIESEAVVESIAKLQSLMAIGQGIAEIDAGTKAFAKFSKSIQISVKSLSTFKKALVATGLGALVVVLGLIYENWDKISAKIEEVTGGLDIMTIATSSLKAGWEALKQTFIAVGNTIVTYVKTPFESVINAVSAFANTDGSLADKLKAAASALKETVVENWSDVGEEYQKIGEKAGEAYQAGIVEGTKKKQEEASKKLRDEQKKQLEEYRKKEQERLDIQLEINKRADTSDEERLKNEIKIEEERLKLYDENTLEYQRQLTKIKELQDKYKELTASSETPSETENAEEDPEIARLKKVAQEYLNVTLSKEEYFKKTEKDLKDALDRQLINEEQYTIASNELAKDRAEYQSEQNDKIVQSAMQLTSIASGTIADILNGIADQQDQSNEEGFEKAKKLQIAAATIQMLTGIATALAGTFTTHTGIWDIAIATAQAASIAASGAINIAKIKNTKYNSSGSSTPSVNSSTVSSNLITPTQYSQAVQGAKTEQKIGDQKVYVVESDITSAIKKVNVAESEARY